jgi:hypothetical protein
VKKVVGLLGKAGSGKSTAAKFMAERYGAERLSIAVPLKRIVQALYGFTDEQVFGDAKIKETVDPRWGVTPRSVMEKMCDAGIEHIGRDVWIRGVINQIEKSDKELFVIEDVRFTHDCEAIARLGATPTGEPIRGHVIKLVCTTPYSSGEAASTDAAVDAVPMEMLTGIVTSHISEDGRHLKSTLDQVLRELHIV